MSARRFPAGFKFGVATAAYQIEGAWNADDKTPSIWDTMCRVPGAIADNTTGDDVCKSYLFYKRDIEMLKFLGVDSYRFSINWPRLFPNGFTNKTSEAGRKYYNNLIDELIENNIEPIVTIYHWDLPQSFQDLGGWTNPLIVDWFGDYARALYTLFGDRVKTWVTINEPKQIGLFGYGLNYLAPKLNACGIAEYLVAKHIVLCNARAWHIYNDEFRKIYNGICGIVIASDTMEGATDSPEDIETGLDAMEFSVGLYSHPIFSAKGGFPERVVRRVAAKSAEQGFARSRLPEFTPEEIEYCKGTSDYYGFNQYSSSFYTRENYKPGMHPSPSYNDDIGAVEVLKDYERGALRFSFVIPEGFRKGLKWVKENCGNPKIIIMENGFNNLGGLNDFDRISFLQKYIDAMLDAIELDGCNVTSYTVWSLMDNFEWSFGTRIKFGLFEVDFEDENRKRTAKCSALWYKNLIKTRALDYSYVPKLEEYSF